MIRYYLSDVVGDGSIENPFRPVLADIPSEPGEARSFEVNEATGQSLAVVSRVNHGLLIAAPGVDAMPDAPLDVKINAIRTETISAIEDRIAARGFTHDWAQSSAFRDIIRSVGKQINPNFDENNFGPQ